MIRNIIFDFGGVLIDWNPRHLYDNYFGNTEQSQWFLENICTMQWNLQMDKGKPFAEGIAELTAQYPEWTDAIALYRSQWIQMIGGEIKGMYEYLQQLKAQGFHLYGLTNWSTETLAEVINDYPVFRLFEGIVVSGEEHLLKPDPAIYECLLRRYRLQPAECLFIDDNPDNILGARQAGISALLFTDLPNLKEQLQHYLK